MTSLHVARHATANLGCGDRVYIRQQDVVKEVQDQGAWTGKPTTALDNFNTSNRCDVGSLPDSVYIKLYDD